MDGVRYRIDLTNVSDNDSFTYSLPLIKGRVSCHGTRPPDADNRSLLLKRLGADDRPDHVTTWPVVNGRFKCLADLNPGSNRFDMEYRSTRLRLNFRFRAKTTDRHVLPVYVVCTGSDGRFQAPDSTDDSPDSACRRIALGARLIQSLTAEKLRESGMTRKTFRLARDVSGDECLVFRSGLTCDRVYDMRPEEIWEHFGRELLSSPYGSDRRKFLAFLSCTRYDTDGGSPEPETHEEVMARMRGHVALGGGGLAVFGTGCLHTWPETVEEIVPKFSDPTKVDKSRFMDDSCYRGTYGGCFSTTLGAVCHELGHAFDLGHSRKGIMSRGFDNINLVFTVPEADVNRNVVAGEDHVIVRFTRDLSVTYTAGKSRTGHGQRSPRRSDSRSAERVRTPRCRSGEDPVRPVRLPALTAADDSTFWDRSCAVLLAYHKWFCDDDQNASSSICFDPSRNTVRSSAGVRVVELRGDDGLVLASWEFVGAYAPKQFKVPLRNVNVKNARSLVAEDSSGSIVKQSLGKVSD